jgi:CRISPR-associated protein Csm5
MTTYTVHGEVLTPIHIGIGDQIDPMEYVIEGDHFYRFDLEKTVQSMDASDRQRFVELCDSPDPASLRKFVVEKLPWKNHVQYKAKATSSVQQAYKGSLEQVRNQLLISPIMRDPISWRPFIPGSSLKGAMRTALLNKRVKSMQPKPARPDFRDRWAGQTLEGEILGNLRSNRRPDIMNDPFKLIKVSDAFLPQDSISVAKVANCHRTQRGIEPLSIQMFMECVEASPRNPVPFTCLITVVDNEIPNLRDKKRLDSRYRNLTPISLKEIMASSFEFFTECFEEESERFYAGTDIPDFLKGVLDGHEWFEDETLMRVGRFSHFESMTIADYRNLQRPRRTRIQREYPR